MLSDRRLTTDHRLTSIAAPSERRLRLLIAERDADVLGWVAERLGTMAFDVASARSGEAVLDALARERFDVVGLDIELADMNGLSVLAAVRGRGDQTPVVLITGIDHAEIAAEGLKAGARDFIVKSKASAYPDLLGNTLRQAHRGDVLERARAQAESSRDVLMRELAHRVKNQLAVVSSIATSSGRRATDVQTFVRDFGARIQAISAAYDLLFRSDWQPVAIETLVEAVLAVSMREPAHVDLPPLKVDAQTTQAFGMALHELAANAVRHGSLAHGGSLRLRGDVDFKADGQYFVLDWVERSPAPIVEPSQRGYGLGMIHNVLRQLNGAADFRWNEGGLEARLSFRISDFGQD